MNIAPLKEQYLSRYDELAGESGTIFNSTKWISLFGNKIRPIGIYNDNEELIGGFHLYTEKKFGLTVCRNAPFTPHCGPFLKIVAKNPVAIRDNWKKALSLMARYIESLSLAVVSISLDNHIIDTQPFFWREFKVIPGYTYLIDLALPVDAILKNMSPERRNDIKKGERSGINVDRCTDYQSVQALVKQSFSRQNMTVNNAYLESILFKFADGNNSFAFVAKDDHRPIAAAFCIHDRTTAYYLLGGYAHENKHRSAGPLVCWEAIKYAKQIGLKTFDFEGSMVPAIESYFRGFGGELTPNYRINKAILPIEIILKFFKRSLF